MRDEDARGTRRTLPPVGTPTSNFRRDRQGPEGEPHSFAPPLAYVFGLDVHGLLFFFTSLYVCAADGA